MICGVSSNPLKDKEKESDRLYIKVFQKYFEKEIERNPPFKEKYKEDRLAECYAWVKEEVHKLDGKSNCVMIQSGKVFEMAVSFFDDEIWKKLDEEKARKQKEEEKRKAEQKARDEEKAKKDKAKAEKEKAKKEYEEWARQHVSNDEKFIQDQELLANATEQSLFD